MDPHPHMEGGAGEWDRSRGESSRAPLSATSRPVTGGGGSDARARGSGSDAGGAVGTSGLAASVQETHQGGMKGVIACLSCRRQKIKCFPPPPPSSGPCKRCKRMDLACDYVKHNRGRKKKVRADEGGVGSNRARREEEGGRRWDGPSGSDAVEREAGRGLDEGTDARSRERYRTGETQHYDYSEDRHQLRHSGTYLERSPDAYRRDRTLEDRHFPFLPLPPPRGYDRPPSAGSFERHASSFAPPQRYAFEQDYAAAGAGAEMDMLRARGGVERPSSPEHNYLPPLRTQPRGSIFSLRSMLRPFPDAVAPATGRYPGERNGRRSRSPSVGRGGYMRDTDRNARWSGAEYDRRGSLGEDAAGIDLPEEYDDDLLDEDGDSSDGPVGAGIFAAKPDLGPDVRDDDVERQVPTGLPTASGLRAAQERARAAKDLERERTIRAGRPVSGDEVETEGEARYRKRQRSGYGAQDEAGNGRATTSSGGLGASAWQDVAGKDPLSSGLLDEPTAAELFKLFMTELNTAAGILDPDLHTFELVRQRSAFLTSAILCVATKYDTSPGAAELHRECLRMARQHQTLAFAEAQTSLEIVQAITILAVWKEPEDDRAAFYFNRAVVMAKELRLDRIHPNPDALPEIEQRWYHIRQRIWLCLFIINTIWVMQFDQPVTIHHDDPSVVLCLNWFERTNQPILDLSMLASVSLRRKFLHYRDLLQRDAEFSDGRLVSLNVLGRTMSRDLDRECRYWTGRIKNLRNGIEPIKPYIWCGAIKLHLNALLLNQCMRMPSLGFRANPGGDQSLMRMATLPGFHECLEASCEILQRMDDVPVKQISYASDTWLHFTIYAAFFLHSLLITPNESSASAHRNRTGSNGDIAFGMDAAAHAAGFAPPDASILSTEDRTRLTRLIARCADNLERASLQRLDSPALHARFLRHLVTKLQEARRTQATALDAGAIAVADSAREDRRPESSNGPPSSRLAALQDAHMAWSTPLISHAPVNVFPTTANAADGEWRPKSSGTMGLAVDLNGGFQPGFTAFEPEGSRTDLAATSTAGLPAQDWPVDMSGPAASNGGGIWSQLGGVWFDHVMQDMAEMGGGQLADQHVPQPNGSAPAAQQSYAGGYG